MFLSWIIATIVSINCFANVYIEIRTYDRIINLTYWDENILPQNLKLGRYDSVKLEYSSTDFSMIELLATFPLVWPYFLDVIDGDSITIEAQIDKVDIQFKNLGRIYRKREIFEKKRLDYYEKWRTFGGKNSKNYINRSVNIFFEICESSVQYFNDVDENWILLEKFKATGGSAVFKAENGINNSKALNSIMLDSIIGYLEYDHLLNNPLAVNFLSRLAEASIKYNSKELTYSYLYDYFINKVPKSKAKDILLLKMSRYSDSTTISKKLFRDSTYFLNWSLALTKIEENRQKQKSIQLAKSNLYNSVIRYNDTNIILDSLLKENSDKPVLIDIWASWCAPCIEEFKNYPEILKKYADKVNFIFISIDKNHDSWKKAHTKYTKDEKMTQSVRVDSYAGKFYIGGKVFEVAAIPRYIFFDKHSILIDDNAPKPSDPLFQKLLDRYID
jgi:thiol-disulfide isomerase/thioredoxin